MADKKPTKRPTMADLRKEIERLEEEIERLRTESESY